MTPLLESSWQRAWRGIGARGSGLPVRDALVARYGEAHRRYHTLQHLAECLGQLDGAREAADRPDEVEMALWFHDAVYELQATDNEVKSGAWARTALLEAGVEAAVATRVHDLVVLTQHKTLPRTRDEKVLVDVDLSILGAPPERFAEYERQIGEEYAHVPAQMFRLRRRTVLQGFLDRPAIFGTPALHQRLEARARANLSEAIARLPVVDPR